MKFRNILLTAIIFTFLTACSQNPKTKQAETSASATPQVVLLSPADFQQKLQADKGVILDVRTPQEYKKGHLKDARLLNIFDDNFEADINKLDKNIPYYVYCQSGGRSAEAAELMNKKGFKLVYDMDGGFGKWRSANLPFEQ